MRKLLVLISCLVIVGIYSGCECVNVACYRAAQFAIVDKNTQEDLITGPNPKYFIDSLFQKRPSDTSFFVPVYYSTYNGADLLFNDTVLLKLNSTDVDTVVVYYNKAKGDRSCCGGIYMEPQSVYFNGNICNYHGNIFMFEK